jgi:aspartyl-tRNA(Asn)/glutamyl-tRNA(Gln) amidotransferase subunit A
MTWSVEDCAIMLQAIVGHDPQDPASADRPVPDYCAALAGGIKGLRIGVLRHLYEDDAPVPVVANTALEAAFDVLRGLGATLEDVRIRPAQVYHDVKITGAESELYAVHEPALRTRLHDFGEDFLGRTLGALLMSGADYVQASRWRRLLIAEMAPLCARYDVFVTAAPGPAPRLESWRTIGFWQKPSLTTPFNVTGGPALAQCIGYTPEGLPLSMQVVGRPFDDATVLRVAHAYEAATPWRTRRPPLHAHATFSAAMPPVPEPAQPEIDAARCDEIAATCRRAGLTPNERVFRQLCATAPYVDAMVARLRRDPEFYEEPASIVSFNHTLPV